MGGHSLRTASFRHVVPAASFGIHASPYMGTISLTQLYKPHDDGFTIGALLITYTILGGSLL